MKRSSRLDADQPVPTPVVWRGVAPTFKMGRQQAIVVAVPVGTAGKIKTQVVRTEPMVAPLAKGQQAGSLRVLMGDQPLLDVPLVVLDPVDQAGMTGRAWDALRLWIR